MFIQRSSILLIFLILNIVFLSNACNNGGESNGSGASYVLPAFTNLLPDFGIGDRLGLGQTSAWGDFNADDNIDLILTSLDFNPPNIFLLVNKGGTFSDIRFESGIAEHRIRSISWADFDNNGSLDFVAGTIMAGTPPKLYSNTGLEKFKEVSAELGITGAGGVINHTVWADYDLNGFVDLFQANDKSSILYGNNGDGAFKDVTVESGLNEDFSTKSAIFFDFNNDGYQELFLANKGLNTFYKNNGDGTFTNITSSSGLEGEAAWNSVSACSGDYNKDGFIDIYVGNISSKRNALYKNNGDETFTDVTSETDTSDIGDARTCAFVDFDADGWLDILSTNHLNPTRLFRNNGKGKFTDVAMEVGLASPIDVFSASWADFDNNGTLDVFLNGHLGIGLMKNSGNGNNNMILELIGNGDTTNTSAIGSRVTVKTKNKKKQIREVSGGRGCCEQDMLPVHFGLGKENSADIIVRWTDGKQCEFKKVIISTNTRMKIHQTECKLEVL